MADYGYVVKDEKGREIMGPFYSEELAKNATIGYSGRTVGWGRGPWLGQPPDKETSLPEIPKLSEEEETDFANRYSENCRDETGNPLDHSFTYTIYEKVERRKNIIFTETIEKIVATGLTVDSVRDFIRKAVYKNIGNIARYYIRKESRIVVPSPVVIPKSSVTGHPSTTSRTVSAESDLIKGCQYRILKRQTVKRPASDRDFYRLGPTYSLITLYFDNLMTWHVRWFLRERSEWLANNHITIEPNEIPYGENCVIQWTNPFNGAEFHLYSHPSSTTNSAFYRDSYLGHHLLALHDGVMLSPELRSQYSETDQLECKISIARSIAQMKVGEIYLGDF